MKKANEEQARKFAGVFVEHHDLLTAAPSTELQWAIQNPQDAICLFVVALVDRAKKTALKVKEIVKRTLTPWKTINLGGTTTEKLLTAIECPDKASDKEANEVGGYARDITTKKTFIIAKSPEKIDLVILTPRDLGFTENPRTDAFLTKEFLAKWSAENLAGCVIELCPPEVGPQLRLQYQDQPLGEVLWIAMERIAGSDGHSRVFNVKCNDDGELWLSSNWADPDDEWNLDYVLVFRLRKVQPLVA